MQVGLGNDGQWVGIDDDVANVVRTIQDYWPSLRVQVFETDAPALVHPKTAPYQIVERVGDRDFFVMDVWSLDHSVIEKLYMLDRSRRELHKSLNSVVELENEKQRKKLQEPWEERKALGADLITHMGQNPKSSYTFKNPDTGEIVKVSDD